MTLTVFGLPVEVSVVSDGDLPGARVQLEAVHHDLVPGDASVDNRAPITITSGHLEIKIIRLCPGKQENMLRVFRVRVERKARRSEP